MTLITNGQLSIKPLLPKNNFNPMNHVYFNLNRDNNVIDNHSISSSTLKMHLLDNDHFVTKQKPLNLEHVLHAITFNLKIFLIVSIMTFNHK